MKKVPLSVIIHTKNSGKTLETALLSVAFAKQVVVMDMESSDDTLKIAKKHNCDVYSVKDYGFVEPVRNKGIQAAEEDWVLLLDADEEISKGLQAFIINLIENPQQAEGTGFQIPRVNIIFDKKMKDAGWWPDFHLRLFKKGTVTWSEKIHSKPTVTGKIHHLPADEAVAILHHNYSSVTQFVDRSNRYSTITAKQSKRSSYNSTQMMEAFSQEFFRRLFTWHGVQAGQLGLGLTLLQSMNELLVYMKQWEATEFPNQSNGQQTFKSVERFGYQLHYWIADWHVQHSSGLAMIFWKVKRKVAEMKSHE